MNREQLSRFVTSALDLPGELAAGVPRIVVTGRNGLRVENHGGVRRFSGEEVRIASGVGEIVVSGGGLVLAVLTERDLAVEGRVDSVRFPAEGGMER